VPYCANRTVPARRARSQAAVVLSVASPAVAVAGTSHGIAVADDIRNYLTGGSSALTGARSDESTEPLSSFSVSAGGDYHIQITSPFGDTVTFESRFDGSAGGAGTATRLVAHAIAWIEGWFDLHREGGVPIGAWPFNSYGTAAAQGLGNYINGQADYWQTSMRLSRSGGQLFFAVGSARYWVSITSPFGDSVTFERSVGKTNAFPSTAPEQAAGAA
jgi:hypothetical protein